MNKILLTIILLIPLTIYSDINTLPTLPTRNVDNVEVQQEGILTRIYQAVKIFIFGDKDARAISEVKTPEDEASKQGQQGKSLDDDLESTHGSDIKKDYPNGDATNNFEELELPDINTLTEDIERQLQDVNKVEIEKRHDIEEPSQTVATPNLKEENYELEDINNLLNDLINKNSISKVGNVDNNPDKGVEIDEKVVIAQNPTTKDLPRDVGNPTTSQQHVPDVIAIDKGKLPVPVPEKGRVEPDLKINEKAKDNQVQKKDILPKTVPAAITSGLPTKKIPIKDKELTSDHKQFIKDEVTMLLLPEDEIILDQVSYESMIDQMDYNEYIKIFWQEFYAYHSLSKRDSINNFIKNYHEKFYDYGILPFIKLNDKANAHIAPPLTEKDVTNLAFAVIKKGDLNGLRALLDNFSILHIQDKGGNNMLASAVINSHYNIAAYLIYQGINIDLANFEGETPLIIAAKKKDPKMVKLLINAGSKTNIKDLKGHNANFYLNN